MADFAALANIPMRDEAEMRMVEIICLKWKLPGIERECAGRIIGNTEWPFKLVVYDNRPNTPNTARIWNKLIRQATCKWVCVIDSDALVPKLEPCWLTRMMETFAIQDCRVVLPLTNSCSTPAQRVPLENYPAVMPHRGEWSGFCFLMRKSLIDDVGPFDEEFVGYGQDSEFSSRLMRTGGGSYIRRDVFVEHLHGSSFKTASATGEHDAAADRQYAQKLYMEKR